MFNTQPHGAKGRIVELCMNAESSSETTETCSTWCTAQREKEKQDSFQEKLLNRQRDQKTVAQTKGIEHKTVF